MITNVCPRPVVGAALLAMLAASWPAAAHTIDGAEGGTPAHATRHRHAARHIAQPAATARLQPTTPGRPASPTAEGPAPVPNLAVDAPIDNAKQQATTVEPSVFQLHYPPQGDGYTPGSSPQAMDDRLAAKATGVELTIPLQQ